MDHSQRLTHGTIEGYKNFRCRCKKCSEVWELYTQEFRDNIYDERSKPTPTVKLKLTQREIYGERRNRGKNYS